MRKFLIGIGVFLICAGGVGLGIWLSREAPPEPVEMIMPRILFEGPMEEEIPLVKPESQHRFGAPILEGGE